jgi:hypothetical protein
MTEVAHLTGQRIHPGLVALLAAIFATSCATPDPHGESSAGRGCADDHASLANDLDRELDQPINAGAPRSDTANRNDLVRAMESVGR